MGTNFYCRKIPTASEMTEMQKTLAERQYDKLQELISNSAKEYHIGKRSGGWQFLFAPHIKRRSGFSDSGQIVSPWEETISSIKKYLSRDDIEIYNEYGEKFSFYDFWNEEIGYCLFNDPEKYINSEQYYKKYPSQNSHIFLEPMEFTTEEGLRFSTDQDFA